MNKLTFQECFDQLTDQKAIKLVAKGTEFSVEFAIAEDLHRMTYLKVSAPGHRTIERFMSKDELSDWLSDFFCPELTKHYSDQAYFHI